MSCHTLYSIYYLERNSEIFYSILSLNYSTNFHAALSNIQSASRASFRRVVFYMHVVVKETREFQRLLLLCEAGPACLTN